MDSDPNDLLFTNEYIKEPSLEDTNPAIGEEFRKYYENEIKKENEIRVIEDLKNFTIDDTLDDTNLINTNGLTTGNLLGSVEPVVYKKEVKTLVSIDSRDRDKLLYKSPNFFKIFLGKTFTNVKSVKLVSIEFPNTDAVINSGNNVIAWRNQEDIENDIIDNITGTYPIYYLNLRNGSYNLRTLQAEISNQVSIVKREGKTGDFHYFVVDLNQDTDLVSFTSLNLTQLDNDPMSLVRGTNIVKLTYPSEHGYQVGDLIYIIGAKTTGGVSYATLNGAYVISAATLTTIDYEINVKASESVTAGGGTIIKTGKLAPFQLLFGETENTVAPNLGFPLEDSSQRLDSKISKIENYYQVLLRFTDTHIFSNTFEFLNKTVFVQNPYPATNGTTNWLNTGNFTISGVLDSSTILINVNEPITIPSSVELITITFTDTLGDIFVYNAQFMQNYSIDTILISTFTEHNFTSQDVRKEISIFNSLSNPVIDGINTIINVVSPTSFLISGRLLALGKAETTDPDEPVGRVPISNPLLAVTKMVTNIELMPNKTRISCPGHGLFTGDKIQFSNSILSIPRLYELGGVSITYVDSNTFDIDVKLESIDLSTVNRTEAVIGKNIVEITFSNHNFNKITSITDYPFVDTFGTTWNLKRIETQLPHGLTDNTKTRIMQTGITGLDGGYLVQSLSEDTFYIYTQPYNNLPSGTSTAGIIGMSNDFYLYGCESVGGIDTNLLNNKLFTVKDILDENHFTFVVDNGFATFTQKGGGSDIFISSLKHGFSGTQDNTKNDILNRSINLEGENYVFLCCPQLSTMLNTGVVKDVFARITLDQSPGAVVFSYLSNPKEFTEVPLAQLNELEFAIRNYNNSFYDFFDLDYSFTLEITEIQDTVEYFNQSSRMVNNGIQMPNKSQEDNRESMVHYRLN
jgi:hypothetical protein